MISTNSASIVLDTNGNVVAEKRYYAFGETRVTSGAMPTDKLFTSPREMADIGLYHYGARFYSPTLGRFISADTIVPSPANPQTLNRYSYVLNNPLKYIDPSGHVSTNPCDYYPGACPGGGNGNGGGGGSGGGGGGNGGGSSGGSGGGGSTTIPACVASPSPATCGVEEPGDPQPTATSTPTVTPTPPPNCIPCNPTATPTPFVPPLGYFPTPTPVTSITATSYVGHITKWDPTRVDWLDVIIDVGGVAGDVGLLTGVGAPVFEASEILEVVGLVKDGYNFFINGDSSAFNMTIADKGVKLLVDVAKLPPAIGSIASVIDAIGALSKGYYTENIYYPIPANTTNR